MNILPTDNKIQTVKELEKTSTSGSISPEIKSSLSFRYQDGLQVNDKITYYIIGSTTPDASEEEIISKEDKDHFYKMTFDGNNIF